MPRQKRTKNAATASHAKLAAMTETARISDDDQASNASGSAADKHVITASWGRSTTRSSRHPAGGFVIPELQALLGFLTKSEPRYRHSSALALHHRVVSRLPKGVTRWPSATTEAR